MDFDFEKEMVFGRKHINKLKFDKEKYSFITFLTALFKVTDLSDLHEIKTKDYEIFKKFGKDSNTEFHEKFYSYLNNSTGSNIKEKVTKKTNDIDF